MKVGELSLFLTSYNMQEMPSPYLCSRVGLVLVAGVLDKAAQTTGEWENQQAHQLRYLSGSE